MIEREPEGRWLIGKQPELGQVSDIIAKERARLDCGCAIYVGRRTDNDEAASVGIACSPPHHQILALANAMLRESLVAPSSEPLVNVVDRFLRQADDVWHKTSEEQS